MFKLFSTFVNKRASVKKGGLKILLGLVSLSCSRSSLPLLPFTFRGDLRTLSKKVKKKPLLAK